MIISIPTLESRAPIRIVTRAYASFLIIGFALLPAYLIAYMFFFQDPSLRFEEHDFHVIAIAASTLEGLFVAYVTWRCYQSSGEPLLRWMTLGFLGFTMVYALHGAFTVLAHHNMLLFLLYGPASRLTMSILLLVGLLSYRRAPDTVEARSSGPMWLMWIALFLLGDLAVAGLAYWPGVGKPSRLVMEGGALVFSTLNVTILLLRRIRSPLMVVYGISVTSFALSSLAFMLASPWNHMWWLAHAIFAAGFFLLSYGIVEAFRTTRSFSTIFSHGELMARLAEEVARTDAASQELQRTNQKLEHLAATDPLTGAGNRRDFIERIEGEIARAKRGGPTFSLLSLDIDHFKAINDSRGHQGGDDVLRGFVNKCLQTIRPHDYLARVGGEEFMVLLPGATLQVAREIGERVRAAIAGDAFKTGDSGPVNVTVSIGASEFGPDGDLLDAFLRNADGRLYRAKQQGRNRVVSV